MTTLKWTWEDPTEPGWYWVSIFGEWEPCEVYLQGGVLRVRHFDQVREDGDDVDSITARWAGPLTLPEDER